MTELLRLSKRMSELGLCSRREADAWIERGWVRVDGKVVSELGSKVLPSQRITVERQASAEQSKRVLAPLRDLFAATFFFFFGLQINPATLPRALPLAVGLGLFTALTKVLTGYWAARQAGVDRRGGPARVAGPG